LSAIINLEVVKEQLDKQIEEEMNNFQRKFNEPLSRKRKKE